MNKTNIKCPHYHSDKLYKFGFNKQDKQKYQCKQCKPQFALGDGERLPKRNYPRCPKCGKGTYLHHSYKINYRIPFYERNSFSTTYDINCINTIFFK